MRIAVICDARTVTVAASVVQIKFIVAHFTCMKGNVPARFRSGVKSVVVAAAKMRAETVRRWHVILDSRIGAV